MLVHIKELFKNWKRGSFAYPAFNIQNLETTLAVVQAAEELNVPIIMSVSEGTISYAGLETIFEMAATVAVRSKVPIALHMDHGKNMEQLEAGIELGFSSIMIDHSHLPMEDNIRDTHAMAQLAHAEGAWVQGEIGRIRGNEDWISVEDSQALLTTPEEAKQFYEATNIDTFAGSFGTVHGAIKMTGKAKPHVDIQRIADIAAVVPVPLVLHGASGVPDSIVAETIKAGIGIVNIDTELRVAFAKGLRASIEEQAEEIDPRKLMKPVITSVKEAARLALVRCKTQNVI